MGAIKEAETKLRKKRAHKVEKRLKRLKKGKKLKRHVVNSMNAIQAAKKTRSRKLAVDIEDDWLRDREAVELNALDDDILPLDMIDADIDWENSAFASKLKRIQDNAGNEKVIGDIENEKRHFKGILDQSFQELLPVKVDGSWVRQTRRAAEDSDDDDSGNTAKTGEAEECAKKITEDLSLLTAAELLQKRVCALDEAKIKISKLADSILADPMDEILKVKELYRMCLGENVFVLVREIVIKLAITSLCEVFIDILPGYAIRKMADEDPSEKLKKETRKLRDFERKLLHYYFKYLQTLEKNAIRILKQNVRIQNDTFSNQLSILCLDCLGRLLISSAHFNYTEDIINLLVSISASNCSEAIDICCSALGELFHSDLNFRVSAHGAKSIATIVIQKKGNVSPKLLATFLMLNIKEVDRSKKDESKDKLFKKRRMLKKERNMKSKQKYTKQLKKLAADLKEAEAAESISTKLSYATSAMNNVFATYFRVIKRMPTTCLLPPVLEGLAKFAHLISVEFFDDLIGVLGALIEQQHLHLLDSLRCIHTVFTVMSGEGAAINVDPSKFYRAMYRLIPCLAFEKHAEKQNQMLSLMLQTVDLMMISRRKDVSASRVAAFVKRLLAISFLLPTPGLIAILLSLRTFMLCHQKLISMVEETDCVPYLATFRPDVDDPDCCGASSSSIATELAMLSRHPDRLVKMITLHISSGIPSTGSGRLPPEYTTKKPYLWFEENYALAVSASSSQPYFATEIGSFLKTKKMQLTSKNLHQTVCQWIDQYKKQ